MHINKMTPVYADKLERTLATVEILTGHKRQKTKSDGIFIEDKFDAAQEIEHYNNYSKYGKPVNNTQQTIYTEPYALETVADDNCEKSDSTSDIKASNLWEDPLYKEMQNTLYKVYWQRAEESKRYRTRQTQSES